LLWLAKLQEVERSLGKSQISLDSLFTPSRQAAKKKEQVFCHLQTVSLLSCFFSLRFGGFA
jgi:hypothetical protein